LEEAIYREVYEETKLTIQVGLVVRIYANRDQVPKRQTFQSVYLSDYLSGEVQLNQTEHDAYKWLNYGEIGSIDTIDFLRDLIRSYTPT
jgi:8-oxo-dGTP pyrophosphatase MutT (NUDIX family)